MAIARRLPKHRYLPLAVRMKISMPSKSQQQSKGIMLVELIIAVTGSILLLLTALALIESQLNVTRRTTIIERLRRSWSTTISFISTEVSLSERIFTSADQVKIPAACNFSDSEFRFALDIRRDLPLAIYAVKASESRLNKDNTLWRCGPTIGDDGSYLSNSVILGVAGDGLDSSEAGGGFNIVVPSASNYKFASSVFLALKGRISGNFGLSSSGFARVNPLFIMPSETSSCIIANNFATLGTTSANTISISSSGLVCGAGGGDTIIGSSGNDILEAGDAGPASLSANGGNDLLRGTNDNDTITGGAGNDILIGRGGADVLSGGLGTNQYLPGIGSDTINGNSLAQDIVYFPGAKASYTISGSCNKSSCTVSSSTEGSKTLSNVDVIIFSDARIDLP